MPPSRPSLIVLLLSGLASAFTLQNVTVAPTDPSIQYYPVCNVATQELCPGAWWKDTSNPNFTMGTAMSCDEPYSYFGGVQPYMAYSFTGSAIYVYEWLNTTTATQEQEFNNNPNYYVNMTDNPTAYTDLPLTATPQLVLAWKLENLDPTRNHEIGIQHYSRPDGFPTFLTIDHFVVTMTIGPIPKKKGLTAGGRAGIAIGVIVVVFAALIGLICFNRVQRRKREEASDRKLRGLGSTLGAAGGGVSIPNLQWPEPASEIEASEKLAKEGLREEVQQDSPDKGKGRAKEEV